MISCPSCSNELPQDARYCGFCGAAQASPVLLTPLEQRSSAPDQRPARSLSAQRPDHRSAEQAMAPALLMTPARRSPRPPAASPATGFRPDIWHPLLLQPTAAAALPGSRIATPVFQPWPFVPREIMLYMPGYTSLRLLLLLAGVVFLGIFFAPLIWRAGQPGALSWLLEPPFSGMPFIRRSFPLAAGTLLLLAGALPVSHRLRALLSSIVGLLALVLLAAFANWRSLLLLGALILLAAGLLQKRSFPDARPAPLLILLGAGGILSALLLPAGGQLPLQLSLDQLASGPFAQRLSGGLPLLLLILALLSPLAAFNSAPSAWVLVGSLLALLYLPAQTLQELLLSQPALQTAPALAAQASLVISIQLGLLLAAVGLFQLLSPRPPTLPPK